MPTFSRPARNESANDCDSALLSRTIATDLKPRDLV
jgi:hypothetical protein